MRRKLLPRTVFGLLLLVVPAAADAPADQYDPFLRDAVTLTDHWTTLTWYRAVESRASVDLAAAYCNTLPHTGAAPTLPTVKELLTIVDEEPHQEYVGHDIVSKMIDGYAFPNTPVDAPYWTSTPASAGGYWTVNFATGVTAPSSGPAYVRCVK
jgi:hypothetical protein